LSFFLVISFFFVSVGFVGSGGGSVLLVVGRHDERAVTVVVSVPAQPVGQAVWQGIAVVMVGVLGQRLLGPGTVVYSMRRHKGTMQLVVKVGQAGLRVDVVAV